MGVMTVARQGEQFSHAERDVFLYLVGQVSSSIENIALHELVSEQAVTDELTGLSNNRRFRELISKEAARAQRFGHELSLLMVDLDDFKRINDTYGHLQGDEVLRMIGAVLSSESRGVDEPARYGGEEFVVALPETGLAGAVELAERIRARIESEAIPRLEGSGSLRITASVGAASIPESADTARTLIAAADAALYEAKRSGKNRVSGAPEKTRRRAVLSVRSGVCAHAGLPAFRPTDSRYSFHPQPPMGILDDAIRQHLDLKRQRGATESELKELEDEAFGPPTRPGEPDFPGEDSRDQNGNGAGVETAVSEPEAPRAEDPWSRAQRQSRPRASTQSWSHRRRATSRRRWRMSRRPPSRLRRRRS